MTNIADQAHPEGFNYDAGSPHLKHSELRAEVTESLRREVHRLLDAKGECRVLEVGAGHGDFTDPLLAAGASVVVTEMSSASYQALAERYRHNPNVRVVHDSDGKWLAETEEEFDLLVCIAVLHHIPDYIAFLETAFGKLSEGGSFVSWQDPLWYPRQPKVTRSLDWATYLPWRLTRGGVFAGAKARLRRSRGIYDPNSQRDMNEYHVVRKGVDDQAILQLAQKEFESAEILRYWSAQIHLFHRMGARSSMSNLFGCTARNRKSVV